MVFKSLNISYQVSTLLSYCKARDLSWDPKKDIVYLCRHETIDVQGSRAQLNLKEVKEQFLGTSFFSRLPSVDQSLCYRVLLDADPPPIMSITPPALPNLGQSKLSLEGSDQSDNTRQPRSRYRTANGQRSHSNDRPVDHNAPEARTHSAERLQDLGHFSHIQGLQCVNSAKPQAVSAADAARKARNSMPNLLGTPQIASSRYAIAQDTWKTSHRYGQHENPRHSHSLLSPNQNSRHQNRKSSDLEYGGDFQPVHTNLGPQTAKENQPLISEQKDLLTRMDSPHRSSTETPVQGIQSQKGSLHVMRPEEFTPQQQFVDENSVPSHGTLQLVGPEGIYSNPEKPHDNAQKQNLRQRNNSAPPPLTQPAALFELDAVEPPRDTFIAELPADPIAPLPAEPLDIPGRTPSSNQVPTKPNNPRATSAPLGPGPLPASLTIGGASPHTHRKSLSQSNSPDNATANFTSHQTNAYRYSSYIAPPQPATIEAPKAPSHTDAPTYKAYRPFVFTEELNRVDSVSSSYGPHHKRDRSDDSTASHDSSKLAREYQELLLGQEKGYASD